jgi:hypothetical protein
MHQSAFQHNLPRVKPGMDEMAIKMYDMALRTIHSPAQQAASFL